MWFETSNYTLSRSDPDAMTEQWADSSQTYRFDFAWSEECALELNSIWYDEDYIWDEENFSRKDEDETSLSFLCTAHDPVPTPVEGMDWQSEDGLQETGKWEATTDCGVAAETMISTDTEMLDASADPAYIYHRYAEEPEEMDWEPCHCTDADNDIVMRDML